MLGPLGELKGITLMPNTSGARNAPEAIRLARAMETRGYLVDTAETVANRFAVYRSQTEPLIDFYRTTGRAVVAVDGIVVKSLGDGVMAVFTSATAALICSLLFSYSSF